MKIWVIILSGVSETYWIDHGWDLIYCRENGTPAVQQTVIDGPTSTHGYGELAHLCCLFINNDFDLLLRVYWCWGWSNLKRDCGSNWSTRVYWCRGWSNFTSQVWEKIIIVWVMLQTKLSFHWTDVAVSINLRIFYFLTKG